MNLKCNGTYGSFYVVHKGEILGEGHYVDGKYCYRGMRFSSKAKLLEHERKEIKNTK